MIVVVDYEAGNIHSVGAALRRLGAGFVCAGDRSTVARASRIVLPGVGSAHTAMSSLQRQNLVDALKNVRVPVLGICLGLQLLFERSEEEDTSCLGIFPGIIRRFDSSRVKVPHIGWNEVAPLRERPEAASLWNGVSDRSHFYFVHSFYAPSGGVETLAETDYDVRFAAAAGRGNFIGVQFHPELSGESGLSLLKNFLEAV